MLNTLAKVRVNNVAVMNLLIFNRGSSTLKACVYSLPAERLPEDPPPPLWQALVDWTHISRGVEVEIQTSDGRTVKNAYPDEPRQATVSRLLSSLWEGPARVVQGMGEIRAAGHRVVHGGAVHRESIVITPEVREAIRRLSVFAPVHNPVNLEGIDAVEQVFGAKLPQVAVFDTAFHADLSPAACAYPLPYEFLQQGIRRYGFHGISNAYCAQRAARILQRPLADLRLVTCHLGNGCSLTAVAGGKSVDTTMGFTPLEGVMMGTRSGSIDPGILIHLLRQEDWTADRLDQLLNKQSGLAGLSGVSGDLRQVLQARAEGNPRAQLALDVFIHRLRRGVGAMIASLGGLDALVFTAGIGEHSPLIRAAVCEAFGFIGLKLDPAKNEQRPVDEDIAAADSKVRVLVIHTQEDWQIARETWQVLRQD